jgi:hypothetical protein
LVAVILKSEKNADEVPINSKLGVDWMKIKATARVGKTFCLTIQLEFTKSRCYMGWPSLPLSQQEHPMFRRHIAEGKYYITTSCQRAQYN